jgi:hypothetical protein
MMSKNTIIKSVLVTLFLIWLTFISLGHQLETYENAVETQLEHTQTQLRNETVLSKRIINILGPSPVTQKMKWNIDLFQNATSTDMAIDAIKGHHSVLSTYFAALVPQSFDERVILSDIKPLFEQNSIRLEEEWNALSSSITWYNSKLTQFPYTLYTKIDGKRPFPELAPITQIVTPLSPKVATPSKL